MDSRMIVFDRETIRGQGKALDRKDRRIAALKGVITKLKNELSKVKKRL